MDRMAFFLHCMHIRAFGWGVYDCASVRTLLYFMVVICFSPEWV